MQVFINETSLNSQFDNQNSFFSSLKIFLSSIKMISELKQKKKVFRSDNFYYYTGIKGTHLETILKSNPTLNNAFAANLQLVNPKSWQKEQLHNPNSSYVFLGNEYCSTSVAEIAERKQLDQQFYGFLLNFENSQFNNKQVIEVIKDDKITIVVDCNTDIKSIHNWLLLNGYLNLNEEYDENSEIAPMDYQTVLKNKDQFERTNYPKNNGRTVYRKIGTDELWVVDGASKHAGPKAHIEVFNEKTKKHLGTSLYNEVKIEAKYKKEERTISLD